LNNGIKQQNSFYYKISAYTIKNALPLFGIVKNIIDYKLQTKIISTKQQDLSYQSTMPLLPRNKTRWEIDAKIQIHTIH